MNQLRGQMWGQMWGPIQPGAFTKFWIRGEHGEVQLQGKFSVAAHLDSSAHGMPPGMPPADEFALIPALNSDVTAEGMVTKLV